MQCVGRSWKCPLLSTILRLGSSFHSSIWVNELAVSSINVISTTVASYQHHPTSMFHDQHYAVTVVDLARPTPNIIFVFFGLILQFCAIL